MSVQAAPLQQEQHGKAQPDQGLPKGSGCASFKTHLDGLTAMQVRDGDKCA
jgi:hypothetical protein